MSSASDTSIPLLPPDSPGSSVSSKFQEEYDELLKYAVVVPNYDQHNVAPVTINTSGLGQPHIVSNEPVGKQDDSIESESTIQGECSDDEEEDKDTASYVSLDRLPHLGQLPGSTPLSMANALKTQHLQMNAQCKTQKNADEFVAMKMNFSEDGCSPRSMKEDISGRSSAVYSPNVDPDVARMENTLDQWSYELKRNILAEFSQSKIKIIQEHRQQLLKEKERHASQVGKLHNEIENLKELLHTYEQSIERKDQVISNLTSGLQKQKEKLDMAKSFCEWKINHIEQKREDFASTLATKHYNRSISQRVWDSWHSVVESKWKQRVEKACQAKAQEVCMSLTNDYETKIASLNQALEAAQAEVSKLHKERDRYEETMKKAFMRGVCALNLEAMTMFNDGQENSENMPPVISNEAHIQQRPLSGGSVTIQQEPVYQTERSSTAPAARVVTGQPATRGATSQSSQSRISAGSKVSSNRPEKVVSAKISARGESARSRTGNMGPVGLAPPMSSVIVERHQPVVKETIGHATASKYPRSTQGGSTYPQQPPQILHKRIAGQSTSVPLNPNVQTIKVVD